VASDGLSLVLALEIAPSGRTAPCRRSGFGSFAKDEFRPAGVALRALFLVRR